MKRIFLMLAFVFTCLPALAVITTVNKVYRTDTRPPIDIVVAGGFLPWLNVARGGDTDMVNHVEGTTVEDRTTAFVSSAERLEGALRSLGQVAFRSDGTVDPTFHSYLYEIRPSASSSFQVSASLREASSTSASAYRRRSLVDLDNTMNDGIYEVVTLDGFPLNRVIRYAEITAQMLRDHALASMFSPSFWAQRWFTMSTYSRTHDQDTTAATPYPSASIRTPDGRGFVVENLELEEETESTSLSCFGVCWNCSSSTMSTTPPPDCVTRLKLRYMPYSIPLRLFLIRAR